MSFEFHASTKATHKIKRTVCDYRNADFDGLRGALEALNLCNLITRQRRNQLGLDLLEGRIYERNLRFRPKRSREKTSRLRSPVKTSTLCGKRRLLAQS